MTLKSLTIRNFQAHEELAVGLDPRATVIVGPTDAGKSAILRALRWLCLNRPSGEAFVKDGEDGCEVTLRAEGHDVARERGKGVNSYRLGGKVYQSFGADVPGDITKALNVGPENFACQHDAPFWFMLSPGEVSKELNRIVDLGMIDSALAFIAAEARKEKYAAQAAEDRLAASEDARKRLEWAGDADRELAELEGREREAAEAAESARTLKSTLGRIMECGRAAESAAAAKADALRAAESGEAMAGTARRAAELTDALTRIAQARQEWQYATRTAAEARAALAKLKRSECPLCGRSGPT